MRALSALGEDSLNALPLPLDRVAVGRPKRADDVFVGCFAAWATIDPIFAKGAPVDLILFGGEPDERVVKVPSVDVVMKRKY